MLDDESKKQEQPQQTINDKMEEEKLLQKKKQEELKLQIQHKQVCILFGISSHCICIQNIQFVFAFSLMFHFTVAITAVTAAAGRGIQLSPSRPICKHL